MVVCIQFGWGRVGRGLGCAVGDEVCGARRENAWGMLTVDGGQLEGVWRGGLRCAARLMVGG